MDDLSEEQAVQRLLKFGFTCDGERFTIDERWDVANRNCLLVKYNGKASVLVPTYHSGEIYWDTFTTLIRGVLSPVKCPKKGTVEKLPDLRVQINMHNPLYLGYKIFLHRKFSDPFIDGCVQKIEIAGSGNEEAAIAVFNTIQGVMPIGVFLDFYKEKFPNALGFVV